MATVSSHNTATQFPKVKEHNTIISFKNQMYKHTIKYALYDEIVAIMCTIH